MIARAAVLPLLFALAGCAGNSARAPSLAPRPLEARGWAEPIASPPGPTPADPTLDAMLDQQRAALAAGDAVFTAAARRTEALARGAKGDAAGGERWLAAQTALANLDQRRATTAEAVNGIEQLALDRAGAGKPDYPALAELQSAGEAQLDAETKLIAGLQASLPAN